MKICTTNFCRKSYVTKFLRVMKITAFVLLISIMQVSAGTFAQKVTINKTNAPLKVVIDEICKQGGYDFVLDAKVKKHLKPVNINIKESTVENALAICLKDQPLTYTIEDKLIVLKVKNFASKEAVIKDISISGRVSDENGKPIPGVTVKLQNATTATVTTADGTYSITVPDEKTVLVFSFIGFESQSVFAGNRTEINIVLKEQNSRLNEVMVIGYGTQTKAKITGSVSKLSSKGLEDMPLTSFDQALVGQLPGVRAALSTGEPGKNAEINIRGIGTLTAGSQPLVVVDGFPLPEGSNLGNISANDIKSIEVLKDAASAAIYGSRGANGIILITTKTGETGKSQISFNSYTGLQSAAKKIDFMDAYQLAQYTAAGRNNAWVDLNPAVNKAGDPNSVRPDRYKIPEYMVPYLNGTPGLTNTDWQDALFRNAAVQNYDLSVSGASEKMKYYVSGNVFDQDGIIVNSGFKRYSLRVNMDASLTRNLKFGINFNPSYSNAKLITEGGHNQDGVLLSMYMSQPMFPVYNTDGSLAISNQIRDGGIYSMRKVENPVALAALTDHSLKRYGLLGGMFLEYQLLKGLSFKTYLGGNFASSQEDYYRPGYLGTYNAAAPSVATGRKSDSRMDNIITENTVNYSNTFADKHTISILAGYTYQHENDYYDNIVANGFPNDNVRTLNAGNIVAGQTNSTGQAWTLISYLARVQYDYRGKYLLSSSIRRDGSSRFGENSKWGYFPSVSLGWRISEEGFMKNINMISDWKLRASWGQTGNNQIPNYGSQAQTVQSNYVIGNSLNNGFKPSTAPNPNLSWETNENYNLGMDISFLKDRYQFTADVYNSTTKNLLLDVPVPGSSGYASSLRNYGKVRNRGLELSLNTTNTFGQLTWTAGLNFSTNQNKVLQLGPGQDQISSVYMHLTKVGGPIGAFYGYNVIGLYESAADLANSPHPVGSAVGSYKYEDVNRDGKIDPNDRKVLGKFFPDYTFGFTSTVSYKGLDLNFIIQGAQGYQMFQNGAFANLTTSVDANMFANYTNNYFISEGNPDNGQFARPTYASDLLFQDSNFKIKDASYVRVRNISVGYNLPSSWLNTLKITKLRFYVSGQNLFTFTKYPGYNPETNPKPNGFGVLEPGMDWSAYPVARTFSAGLNVTF